MLSWQRNYYETILLSSALNNLFITMFKAIRSFTPLSLVVVLLSKAFFIFSSLLTPFYQDCYLLFFILSKNFLLVALAIADFAFLNSVEILFLSFLITLVQRRIQRYTICSLKLKNPCDRATSINNY